MKKVLILLVLSLMSPCLFAQTVVDSSAIKRAVKVAQDSKKNQTTQAAQQVLANWESFKEQALRYEYYEFDFMFQSMDALRESYMKLHALSAPISHVLAKKINEPISIANGKKTIQLLSYLNMETCTLWHTEQVKFDAFAKALKEDLEKVAFMPSDFKNALLSFRKYVKESHDLNANWVLQSMMPLMDAFNKYAKEYPYLAVMMAEEIQKPIAAGWGGEVVTSTFIKDHGCEVWQIQDELEAFRSKLLELTR